ncbi:DUF1926 domain-containing protein [bacterium]|nr:DUF1926 domain-containing protein [bacterium]
MNLTGIIKNLEKTKTDREFRLDVILKNIIGIDKIHPKTKNRQVSIIRAFSKFAPDPCKGDLIVLSEKETKEFYQDLSKSNIIGQKEIGKVSAEPDDFNFDGYSEIRLSNSIVSLFISPRRGGSIYKVSTPYASDLIDDLVINGIRGQVETGIRLAGNGDFKPEKEKFKLLDLNAKASFNGKKRAVRMRAKSAGLKIDLAIQLTQNSPIIELDYLISNFDKKGKGKDLAPSLRLSSLAVGEKLAGTILIDSNGETYRFYCPESIPPWAWREDWVSYSGNIHFDNSGFVAIRHSKKRNGLLLSFESKKTSRLWAMIEALLPNVRIYSKKKQLMKNKTSRFSYKLIPFDNLIIANGIGLAYVRGHHDLFIFAVGKLHNEISAETSEGNIKLDMVKVGDNLACATVPIETKAIILPDKNLTLEVNNE